MNQREMIRAFMAGLVERAGGVDAAAALIGARLGAEVSKGSISKRQSGQLEWPLIEIMALEDAVGDRCVRRWLVRSLPEVAESQCLIEIMPQVARESGEAMSAVMALIGGVGNSTTARKEVADAIEALQVLAAQLDAQGR